MKAIFRTLACVAALSFFVACGPSVTGNPAEDAKTYVELAKEDQAKADEYLKECEKEYAKDYQKAAEFAAAVAKEAGADLDF